MKKYYVFLMLVLCFSAYTELSALKQGSWSSPYPAELWKQKEMPANTLSTSNTLSASATTCLQAQAQVQTQTQPYLVFSSLHQANVATAYNSVASLKIVPAWQDSRLAHQELAQWRTMSRNECLDKFEHEVHKNVENVQLNTNVHDIYPLSYEYEVDIRNQLFDVYFASYHLHSLPDFVSALQRFNPERYCARMEELGNYVRSADYAGEFKKMPGRRKMETFEFYLEGACDNARGMASNLAQQKRYDQKQYEAQQEIKAQEQAVLDTQSKELEQQWNSEAQLQAEEQPAILLLESEEDASGMESFFENETKEYALSSCAEELIDRTDSVLREQFSSCNGTEQQHVMHGRFVTAVDQVATTFSTIAFQANGYHNIQEFADFSQCAVMAAKHGIEYNMQGQMVQAENLACLCEHMAAFANGVQTSANNNLEFARKIMTDPWAAGEDVVMSAKNISLCLASVVVDCIDCIEPGGVVNPLKAGAKMLEFADKVMIAWDNTTTLNASEKAGMVITDLTIGWLTGNVLGSSSMVQMLGTDSVVLMSELRNMKPVIAQGFYTEVYPVVIQAFEEGAASVKNSIRLARSYPQVVAAEATVAGAVEQVTIYVGNVEKVLEEVNSTHLFQEANPLVKGAVKKAKLPELFVVPVGEGLSSGTVNTVTFYLDKFGNKWNYSEGVQTWMIELSPTMQKNLSPALEVGQTSITYSELETILGNPRVEPWAESLQVGYVDYMQSQAWSKRPHVNLDQPGADTFGHLCEPGTNMVTMQKIRKYCMDLDKLRCNNPYHLANWAERLPQIETDVAEFNSALQDAYAKQKIETPLREVTVNDFYHLEHGHMPKGKMPTGRHTTMYTDCCGIKTQECIQFDNGIRQINNHHISFPNHVATKSIFPWDGNTVFQKLTKAIRENGLKMPPEETRFLTYNVTLENDIVVVLRQDSKGLTIYPEIPK
ncbi:hypothetical protein HOM50_03160 [bacterium]|nr:hypothetical protein [bacterium]MBT5015375.1 hypothetical protein [bacterium]